MPVPPWPRYGDYYPIGSREELEFRLTHKLVMTARAWTKLIDRQLRQRTEHSRARWETMFAIAFSTGPITTRSISELLGLRWPTLVRVLDELERDGIIKREDNPADGRSRLIRLSERGMDALILSKQAIDPLRHEVAQDLTDEDLTTCVELLHRVHQIVLKTATD